MTSSEILLHIVHHAACHRGLVSDMPSQMSADMPANDLPISLRDAR